MTSKRLKGKEEQRYPGVKTVNEKSPQKNVANPKHVCCSVLISADFVVSSRVQENLLLSIALQRKDSDCNNGKTRGRRITVSPNILLGVFTSSSPFNRFTLGYHATRVAIEPNAGGASVVSEVNIVFEYTP